MDHEVAASARRFLLAALDLSMPKDITLAALRVICEPCIVRGQEAVFVDAVLAVFGARTGECNHGYEDTSDNSTDRATLEACVAALRSPTIDFSRRPAGETLIRRITDPDVYVQRATLQLLTMQISTYPALLIPAVRIYVRETLLAIDAMLSERADSPLIHAHLSNLCLAL